MKALASILLLLVGFWGACANAQETQSVTLAWDPSAATDVAGYRLHFGTSSRTYSQSVNVGNATTVTLSNLVSNETYYFAVTAYDLAAQESVWSNEATYSTIGNLPPTVSIMSPSEGTSVNGPAQITLTASASDSDGSITRTEFYDGATKIGEDTNAPYSIVWNNVQPGQHMLSAVAYDDTGAAGTSQTVSLNVSRLAISQSVRLEGGEFRLTATGAVGQAVSVYCSSDLETWSLLETVMNTSGTVTITDPEAASLDKRFYKLVSQ
jgi:chitodextrinase